MFKLELDMSLRFVPPMLENSAGFVVTRTMELPFVPFDGLVVYSRQFTDHPDPEAGHKLENVTWDMDRKVFLAQTSLTHVDLPMGYILQEIRDTLRRGWRLGSYADSYQEQEEAATAIDEAIPVAHDDWKNEENWPSMAPSERPAHFNDTFGFLIGVMAVISNNPAVAYAMERTKRFFTEQQLKTDASAAAKKWLAAKSQYEAMSWEKQYAWQKRMAKKYAPFDRLTTS